MISTPSPPNPLPHVLADKRIFPVALVYKLLKSLNRIFRRLINDGQPTGHRLDAFSFPVEDEASQVRHAPVFPLTTPDARCHVFDERQQIGFQLLKLPCIHAKKHDAKTSLAQDQLT
jgi:hypothetical protein